MNPGFRFETATRMILTSGGEAREQVFPDIDHFGAQTAYFSDCIREGIQPEPNGYEGLADVRALLAIEAAVKTGTSQHIATPFSGRNPAPNMVRMIERTERRLVL